MEKTFSEIQQTSLDGDLLIVNGDLVVGDGQNQAIYDIISGFPGYLHEYPFVGVGLGQYQDSTVNTGFLSSEIILQLQADGFVLDVPVITLNAATGQLEIVPNAQSRTSR